MARSFVSFSIVSAFPPLAVSSGRMIRRVGSRENQAVGRHPGGKRAGGEFVRIDRKHTCYSDERGRIVDQVACRPGQVARALPIEQPAERHRFVQHHARPGEGIAVCDSQDLRLGQVDQRVVAGQPVADAAPAR